MARLTLAEQAAIIGAEISRAEYGVGELEGNRKEALDYIYGRPRGDEINGRSQVVSTDVADMISAVLSQIMPGLAGTEAPCAFMPDGPGDEDQAAAETMAVNRVIMSGQHGYQLVYSLCWNALALKNGWAKAWAEDRQQVAVRELDEATEQQKQQLLAQPLKPGATRSIDGDTLRGVTTRRVVRISSVDPENMLYPADAETIDTARFIAERKLMTRSELLELGYSKAKVMELPAHTIEANSTARVGRRVGGIEDPANAPTRAQDLIECYEVYTKLDISGNGMTELRRYIWSNQTILDHEAADFIPYCTGSPWPIPSRITGMSMHDKVKSVQDISTALWRSTLDNFAASVFQEVVVNDQANVDDFLNRRPAGVNRVDGPDVRAAVMGMPITPQVDAGLAMMQHLKGVRAERGGSALEMATGEMQLFESQVGSQGLDRTMSVQEQISGMVARNLAEGLVKHLYLLVHTVMRTQLNEPLTLLMAGEWQTVDPRKFRPRDDISLKAGLTQGEQSRKQAAISQLMGLQKALLEGGLDGVIVDLNNMHNLIMDYARCSGIDAPERYFVDPQSQASRKSQQGKGQQAQQAQQLQQQALQLEQLDRQIKIQELRFKYWEAQLKSEVEEAKIIAAQIGALELAELNAAQGQGQAAGAALSRAGTAGANGAAASG